MPAEIVFHRFSIMSLFQNRKLSEQCFSAAADGARDKYEQLTQQKIKLQRKLQELEAQGKGSSDEYKNLQSQLESINSQL